jgi:hypothetical protein
LSDLPKGVDDLGRGKKSDDRNTNARDDAQREAKKFLDADKRVRNSQAQAARDSGRRG